MRVKAQKTITASFPVAGDLDCSIQRARDATTKEPLDPCVWIVKVAFDWKDVEGQPTDFYGHRSMSMEFSMDAEGSWPTEQEILDRVKQALVEDGWQE